MKKSRVKSAVEVLMMLFYDEENKNEELALQTMELYISDLKMLSNIEFVAETIEKQKAFVLVHKLKLFDMEAAIKVERRLRGYPNYTVGELYWMRMRK
ncbi:hypothetical protein [Pseudalkalibacillus caeni]|uniref:Uncharacterized protein n=1 Tax=Exobacillus caeni TaxID=2574798 RepID=A0A5R9FC25_9BACL|nr:hypothetical protein [Pseudalkalibacillus caeni]TLS38443.1 hypothetical protein FCL54_04710 [Pseudalkalibacillus caeni]